MHRVCVVHAKREKAQKEKHEEQAFPLLKLKRKGGEKMDAPIYYRMEIQLQDLRKRGKRPQIWKDAAERTTSRAYDSSHQRICTLQLTSTIQCPRTYQTTCSAFQLTHISRLDRQYWEASGREDGARVAWQCKLRQQMHTHFRPAKKSRVEQRSQCTQKTQQNSSTRIYRINTPVHTHDDGQVSPSNLPTHTK